MKIRLLIISVSLASLLNAQSFEGTLTYATSMEISENMKKMGMTREQLLEKMKAEGSWCDTIRITYKNGDYRILMNTSPPSWSVYKSSTNKIYSFQGGEGSDICTVTNASIDVEAKLTGKNPVIQQIDTAVYINEVNCKIVRVKWRSGTYDYYYNPLKLQTDPSLYARHVYDGWAEFTRISHALPLMIVKKIPGMMTLTMILLDIHAMPVSSNLFVIPELVPDEALNSLKTGNREIMRIKR